jgi:CRP-like cAMP-binding protein
MAILREDLASMVGTAKETVIRTLSDFRDEKIIEMKGSKITILKPEALRTMLN